MELSTVGRSVDQKIYYHLFKNYANRSQVER